MIYFILNFFQRINEAQKKLEKQNSELEDRLLKIVKFLLNF